jgi:hypothetical protein
MFRLLDKPLDSDRLLALVESKSMDMIRPRQVDGPTLIT